MFLFILNVEYDNRLVVVHTNRAEKTNLWLRVKSRAHVLPIKMPIVSEKISKSAADVKLIS